MLGELDPERRRTVEAAPLSPLLGRRGLDDGIVVTEHDRSVRAHVVDVLVAIDVPNAGPLASLEEIRERAFDEHARRLVSVDAARNHAPGALEELLGATKSVVTHGRPFWTGAGAMAR